jgi:hypothetical protein
MKTRIEKRGPSRNEPESENVEDHSRKDAMTLSVAITPENLAEYGVSGEEYLKRMGTFDFDPAFFKEFEELQQQMREQNHGTASE